MKKCRYLIAFLLPIIIVTIYILSRGGNLLSFYVCDLREQYIFLFDYLKQVMSGDQSLFYSYNVGLGQSMIGTYAYYLSSPFNLLLFFIPENGIMYFISILILIKIGLCGLTMFTFLGKNNKNEYYINIMFSLCYALMSYNVLYYFNIMWLDIILLTPIVLLGINKLIEEKKPLLYIIMLFLCIISNYYLAYILCIFCIIYFIYESKKKKLFNKTTIKMFLFSSLLAGGLSSFLTIPVIMNLKDIYRANEISYFTFLKKMWHLLISLGFRQSNIKMDYNYPNIYCGLINIIILVNYFLFSKNKKEKKYTTIIFIIFFLSIFLTPLIYIWHGFSYPMGLFYRFSYLISLFMIIISASHFSEYKQLTKKQQLKIIAIYTILLVIGYVCSNEINWLIILFNIMFFTFNMVLLNRKNKDYISKIGIIFLVIFELFLNFKMNFFINESILEEYQLKIDNNRFSLYDSLSDLGNQYTRIDGNNVLEDNEKILINKGSPNLFLSSNNKNIYIFLKNSGYSVSSPYISSNTANYFINSILGVKYWYGDNANKLVYKKIDNIKYKDENIDVYENQYALSIGFLVGSKKKLVYDGNPFEYQNQFSEAMINEKMFYEINKEKIKSENKIEEFKIDLKDDEYIYIYSNVGDTVGIREIYINDKLVFDKGSIGEIITLKNNYKNEQVKIKFKYSKLPTGEIKIYSEESEKTIKILKKISDNQLNDVFVKKDKLKGTIDCKKNNCILMLTIPYDENLIIRIDGEKINYSKIYDSFISIKLDKGVHDISVEYNYKIYYISSFITLSFVLVSFIFVKKCKKIS